MNDIYKVLEIATINTTHLAHVKNPNKSNISSKIRKVEDVIDINYLDNIQCIYPYYDENMGLWVFDDAEKNLQKEALIEGIDDMLDYMVKEKGLKERKLGVAFSNTEIQNHDVLLELIEPADPNGRINGNMYRWTKNQINGWLCPSLYKYFEEAPKKLYMKILTFGVN